MNLLAQAIEYSQFKLTEMKATIDGESCCYAEDETILDFVKRTKSSKLIPTLCDAPNLEAFGSCRVCSVDVALKEDGPRKTMASCYFWRIWGLFGIFHRFIPSNNYFYTFLMELFETLSTK